MKTDAFRIKLEVETKKKIEGYAEKEHRSFAGMRFGELAALDWKQINGSILLINRAFKNSGNELGLPKWDKTREIPLSKRAQSVLPPRGFGLVFNREGRRFYQREWYKRFYDAVEKAKIPRITPHSLRHTVNTELLFSNTSPFLIQQYLGWSNNQPTDPLTKVQRGYTHVKEHRLQPVADAIDLLYTEKQKEVAPRDN